MVIFKLCDNMVKETKQSSHRKWQNNAVENTLNDIVKEIKMEKREENEMIVYAI